ncbi:MAG: ABC transporter ATP-binding protein [Oscillospiraceae bacterium]|nr:ABC transporter ATP-binding protein [Oscillospiraceae bacterium]
MWRKFFSYYKPHRKLFLLDMSAAFLVSVGDLFYPIITRNIINEYIPNKELRLILIWAAVLLGIYLVRLVLNYIIDYFGHKMGVLIQSDMREKLFSHLQKLPFSFFDENKTGSLMSRVVNDLMEISELAHHGPEDLFLSLMLLIGSFTVMMTMNPWLTLIIFACLPFFVLFAAKTRLRMSDAFARTRKEIAEVNADVENSISGVRVSKSFTSAETELKKFRRSNAAFVKARLVAYRVMAEFFSGMNFFINLLNLVVLVAGGLFTYYGMISAGDFVAYLLYVNIFFDPIKRLVNFIEQYQSGMTGFRRYLEILDTEPEPEAPDARELTDVKGDIVFDKVSFAYNENQDILHNVSLTIPAGKTVALIGPSGGGKTTLCHLIPRFYEISGGKITVDGKDIRSLTRQSLRQNIGMVAQDVFLFTGTIRDNIAYGTPNATEEQIRRAAEQANLAEFIAGLPEGYDTYIGERGVKLSGGQKQRISIARVFLKNPPILILDEATSALDNVTEEAIRQSLEKLSQGRTTLVVAHRLSTVRDADELLVMTDRGIEERGTHAQLLAADGIYATLYRTQFEN